MELLAVFFVAKGLVCVCIKGTRLLFSNKRRDHGHKIIPAFRADEWLPDETLTNTDDWYKATTRRKGVSGCITSNCKRDLCAAQWMEPPKHSCRSQVIFLAAMFSSEVQSKHVCLSSCRSCVNREESACCCLCVHTGETAQQSAQCVCVCVCVCVWERALQLVNTRIQNIFHPVKRLEKVIYSRIYAMWHLHKALHCVNRKLCISLTWLKEQSAIYGQKFKTL